MTTEDKLAICQVCSKRSFDSAKGIVCSLTGDKPAFEGACENYGEDAAAAAERAKRKEEAKKPADIEGFFAFYLFWSIPIGIILTLVFFILNFKAGSYSGSTLLQWFDISSILFYTYFGAYTIYAFVKQKSDAVFIGKYQLILLFASNLLVLLLGATDGIWNSVPRVVASLIWIIIFFLFLSFSEDVNDRIPKETRKLTPLNKVMLVLSIILPLFFFIGGIYQVSAKQNIRATLQQICEQNRTDFPKEVSTDMFLTDMSFTATTFVYDYEYRGNISLFPDGYMALMEDYSEEVSLLTLVDLAKQDPLFTLLAENGYYLLFRYSDSSKKPLYSFTLSNDEMVAALKPEYSHKTDPTVFSRIISNYSKMLPYTLFENCDITGMRLGEDEMLHCELFLNNLDSGVLPGLTSTYLKDYMKSILPYMSDIPLKLAMLNQMPISFDFTCDRIDWWKTSAVFSPADYSSLTISTGE